MLRNDDDAKRGAVRIQGATGRTNEDMVKRNIMWKNVRSFIVGEKCLKR